MNIPHYGVDIEVFPDFHSFTAIDADSGHKHVFVLHATTGRDDRAAYLAFLKTPQVWITFNGLHYDYPVVHQIMTNKGYFMSRSLAEVNKTIHRWSCEIINGDRQVFNYQHLINQYDLFKIWHFDNKARSASLKHIEFFLRWRDLRDMPMDPHSPVGGSQTLVDEILVYNENDVLATLDFWLFTQKEGRIKLRKDVLNKYGIDVTNKSDVSIGSELLAKFLSDDMNIDVKTLKTMRTVRKKVPLKDCMPSMAFRSKCFQDIYNFFDKAVVKSTKGSFDDLTCVFDGVQFKYGTGGLHAATTPGVYKSDEHYMIIDIDVASYYPNMAINYGYKPEHLGSSFGNIYKWMFEQRALIPKSDPINTAFKLALNGSFGRMGSPDSFLFDLKSLLSITVTGQVLLTKLIEDLVLDLNDCKVLQVNTDGATFRLPRTEESKLKQICQAWEVITNLKLEFATYDKMAIRDVNNYCALSGDYLKAKGDFEIDKEAHKNHSQRIVSIAAVMQLLLDIPVDSTINNHMNTAEYTQLYVKKGQYIESHGVFDFCHEVRARGEGKKGKAKLYQQNEITGQRDPLQKINRYYISNTSPYRIIKKYDDGTQQLIQASKGAMCKVINKVIDLNPTDINYKYYITEANKLVESVKGDNQLSLF